MTLLSTVYHYPTSKSIMSSLILVYSFSCCLGTRLLPLVVLLVIRIARRLVGTQYFDTSSPSSSNILCKYTVNPSNVLDIESAVLLKPWIS
jgi:hypothetical protein